MHGDAGGTERLYPGDVGDGNCGDGATIGLDSLAPAHNGDAIGGVLLRRTFRVEHAPDVAETALARAAWRLPGDEAGSPLEYG